MIEALLWIGLVGIAIPATLGLIIAEIGTKDGVIR